MTRLEKRIQELKQLQHVTFDGSCISWNSGLWTISQVTEKAICIDGEWIPKSQIIDICMIEKKLYDAGCNYTIIVVPELLISEWFDKKNNQKRKKGYAF